MTTFDPFIVTWSYKEAEYGRSLALHYGDDLHFAASGFFGARPKYPFRDLGVMVKAVITDDRWGSQYRTQCEGDWVVWNALPPELRAHAAPLAHYGSCQVTDTRKVHWSAQEWVEGEDDVTIEESKVVYDLFKAAGFHTSDEAPCQLRRRPDGRILVLDYGSWFVPGEDPTG